MRVNETLVLDESFISQRSLLWAPLISYGVSPVFCHFLDNKICRGPENMHLLVWWFHLWSQASFWRAIFLSLVTRNNHWGLNLVNTVDEGAIICSPLALFWLKNIYFFVKTSYVFFKLSLHWPNKLTQFSPMIVFFFKNNLWIVLLATQKNSSWLCWLTNPVWSSSISIRSEKLTVSTAA